MKKAMVLMAAAAILASGLASADEVLEVHEDRAVGGGFGRAKRARARDRAERQPARRRRAGDRRSALRPRRGQLLPLLQDRLHAD